MPQPALLPAPTVPQPVPTVLTVPQPVLPPEPHFVAPPALPLEPPAAEPPHHAVLPSLTTKTTIEHVATNAEAGRIIGTGGGMIKAIHDAHPGVKIQVRGNRGDERRPVVFTGTADAIERARQDLVGRLMAQTQGASYY